MKNHPSYWCRHDSHYLRLNTIDWLIDWPSWRRMNRISCQCQSSWVTPNCINQSMVLAMPAKLGKCSPTYKCEGQVAAEVEPWFDAYPRFALFTGRFDTLFVGCCRKLLLLYSPYCTVEKPHHKEWQQRGQKHRPPLTFIAGGYMTSTWVMRKEDKIKLGT